MPKDEKNFYIKFEIKKGYQLLIFKTEDYLNDVYIAAKYLTYNTELVYYKKKPYKDFSFSVKFIYHLYQSLKRLRLYVGSKQANHFLPNLDKSYLEIGILRIVTT